MNSRDKKLPEDQEQSAIINSDAEFENRSIDRGFVFAEKEEDRDDAEDRPQGHKSADEQDEQGTERGAPGLGELDGTNPGSNHHPVDS